MICKEIIERNNSEGFDFLPFFRWSGKCARVSFACRYGVPKWDGYAIEVVYCNFKEPMMYVMCLSIVYASF